MKRTLFDWKWFIPILVLMVILAACGSEATEQPSEATTPPEVAPTAVEPTEVEPTAVKPTLAPTLEPTPEPTEELATSEREPGVFDFEDGTTQGWRSREDKSTVSVASDLAHSGSYSLLVTDRIENFEGTTVDVLDLLEPGSTYLCQVGSKARTSPNSSAFSTA